MTAINFKQIGVIIVDHGSRRAESNQMLLQIVDGFRQSTNYPIVEPAHMELAEPTLQVAFDRCVERGARFIVIHPYFLLPGRHWDQDIPHLASLAAVRHAGISYLVTAPLGHHPLMAKVIEARIEQCLSNASHGNDPCESCRGTAARCQIRGV